MDLLRHRTSTPLRDLVAVVTMVAMPLLAVLGATGCDRDTESIRANVGSLTDAGSSCPFPTEGCACAPGTDPVECIVDPITVGGAMVCQHGTRSCRDSVWTACEDITQYLPSGNKILNAPGTLSDCRPDEFSQTSIPDTADLTPVNSSNLTYTTSGPTGLTLTQTSVGMASANYGLGVDTDRDGAPDSVDACPADPTAWIAAAVGGGCQTGGFYHTLPLGTSAIDPLNILLQVKTVDMYLLVDTTASMSGEIANLRSGLATLMGDVQTLIPGSYFGVGMFRDYPIASDGNTNDLPYMHLLDPTSSVATAQLVVNNALDIDGNVFWPESGGQALYSLASGRGLGRWTPNRAACTNGGFGYACFRPGTIPVAIVVTDAPFWNGASYAAPAADSHSRPELSYNPYPGTSGSDQMAGVALPRAEVTSAAGGVIRSNDTFAQSWNIGDITNRSVTINGSTAGGGTAAAANDHTTVCSGATGSGPDVFYSFTLTQPRPITIEAYGDYDTLVILKDSTNSSVFGCDDDSGALADANGNTVFDLGSRLTSYSIPMSGCTVSASTNVTFTGCTPAGAVSNLTGCTIPSGSATLSCTFVSGSSTAVCTATTGTPLRGMLMASSRLGAETYAVTVSKSGTTYTIGMSKPAVAAGAAISTACSSTLGQMVCAASALPLVGDALAHTSGTARLSGTPSVTSVQGSTAAALITFSPNAASATATTGPAGGQSFAATSTTPSTSFVGCIAAGGTPIAGARAGGTGLGTSPYLTAVSATSPYTISVTNPVVTGATLTSATLNAGLSGCVVPAGVVPTVGVGLSGSNIAAGTTVSSITSGSGTGPYSFVMSIEGTSLGATTNEALATTGGMLPAGTYTVVVDAYSSTGYGTFGLRLTNGSVALGAADTTAPTEVSWANTVAALQASSMKTIGIATCPVGCTDLATRQTSYQTCVEGTGVISTATGADRVGAGTKCGAAYGRCIAQTWGTVARCTTIFNACRDAEVYAGRNDGNVNDNACDTANDSCRTNFPSCPNILVVNGCGASWWRYDCYKPDPTCPSRTTHCDAVETACRAGTDVCTTQSASVATCINASAGTATTAASWCDETLYDLDQLGVQTGSVRPDNTPFTFQIAEDGSGLTTTIADAVRELAQYVLFDVTAYCEPTAGTSCTQLFGGANIGTPNPASLATAPNCATCSGPTCTGCTPGTQLPYQATFQNPTIGGIAPIATAQIFDFYIVLRDANMAEMSRTPVRIVVPPNLNTYETTGSFTQTYDGTYDPINGTGCLYPTRRAQWGTFTYAATVPTGTTISFTFRTANTLLDLSTAQAVTRTVTATATAGVIDVGAALVAAGVPKVLPYLQVRSTLNTSPTRLATPTLESYGMTFTCIDAE